MTGHATNATVPSILPQDVQRFIHAVVPSGDEICFGRQRTDPDPGLRKQSWGHLWYGPKAPKKLQHAIENAMQDTCTNWYFAVASYSTAKKRTAVEVKAIKTLLLDVDIGKGEGFIPNKPQVMAELKKLHLACPALPKPWLVDSGNGIHVYYQLDKSLSTIQWGPLASLFAAVVKAVAPGLIADPVRTKDVASVMRLPGSWNAKQKPRLPVRLLAEGEAGDIEAIKGTLSSAAAKHHVSGIDDVIGDELIPNLPSLPAYMNGVGESATFGGGLENTEYDFTDLNLKPIAAGCNQMREILMVRGNVPEPLWVLFLRVILTVKNWKDVAIEFSSGHPTASPAGTVRKLRHISQNYAAPSAGCKEFKELNPKGCYNCPFNKQVWTPSQLAILDQQTKEIQAAEEEAIESAAEGVVTPQGYLPQPRDAKQVYTSGRGDEVTLLPVRQPGKDASYESDVVIYGHLNLKRSTAKLNSIVVGNEESVTLTDTNLHLDVVTQGITSPAVCSVDSLTSSGFDTCTSTLRKMGVVFEISQPKHNAAQHYLHNLVKLSSHNRGLYRPVKGWVKTGMMGGWSFVAGARHYLPDGTTEDNVTSAEHYGGSKRDEGFMERAMTGMPKGDIRSWRTAMRVYDGRGLEVAQLLLLSGLANLLMPLITSTKGGIVLALTGGSGVGKTTLLRFMASFMGDHSRYIVPGASTANAIGMLLQQANCMMLPVDDTLARNGEVFSALLTMVTGGAEKMRMTWESSTGGTVPYDEGFHTSLLLTSNYSTTAAIGRSSRRNSDQLQTEAARTRTLEFPATDIINKNITETQWTSAGRILAGNHGHAAHRFLQYVVANQLVVARDCRRLESEIANRVRQQLPADKAGQVRFWARFLAVTGITAKIVCDTLSILPWDHKRILAAGEALVATTVDHSRMDDHDLVDSFWGICCAEKNPNLPTINFVNRRCDVNNWHDWRVVPRSRRMGLSEWASGSPVGPVVDTALASPAAAPRWRVDTIDAHKGAKDSAPLVHRERTVFIPMAELKALIDEEAGSRLAVTDWSDLYTRLNAAGCIVLGVRPGQPDVLNKPPVRVNLGLSKFQDKGTARTVVEIRLPPTKIV